MLAARALAHVRLGELEEAADGPSRRPPGPTRTRTSWPSPPTAWRWPAASTARAFAASSASAAALRRRRFPRHFRFSRTPRLCSAKAPNASGWTDQACAAAAARLGSRRKRCDASATHAARPSSGRPATAATAVPVGRRCEGCRCDHCGCAPTERERSHGHRDIRSATNREWLSQASVYDFHQSWPEGGLTIPARSITPANGRKRSTPGSRAPARLRQAAPARRRVQECAGAGLSSPASRITRSPKAPGSMSTIAVPSVPGARASARARRRRRASAERTVFCWWRSRWQH